MLNKVENFISPFFSAKEEIKVHKSFLSSSDKKTSTKSSKIFNEIQEQKYKMIGKFIASQMIGDIKFFLKKRRKEGLISAIHSLWIRLFQSTPALNLLHKKYARKIRALGVKKINKVRLKLFFLKKVNPILFSIEYKIRKLIQKVKRSFKQQLYLIVRHDFKKLKKRLWKSSSFKFSNTYYTNTLHNTLAKLFNISFSPNGSPCFAKSFFLPLAKCEWKVSKSLSSLKDAHSLLIFTTAISRVSYFCFNSFKKRFLPRT